MGCTKRQTLFQVQLPMALPEIMLGLNQTIMFGLAMLVIAALVGTRDLGQSVYIALGKANAGQGLVAGLSIALIAMVADRIIPGLGQQEERAARAYLAEHGPLGLAQAARSLFPPCLACWSKKEAVAGFCGNSIS